MSSYPNVYGFCDAGCKRQTMSKEEIMDRINGLTSKLITLTGQTTTGGGGQPIIQMQSDELVETALIELYPLDSNARTLLRTYASTVDSIPSSLGGGLIIIPLTGGDNGINVNFLARITYYDELTSMVIQVHI